MSGAAVVAAASLALGCQESGFDESKETARPLKVQHIEADLAGTKVPGKAERPMTLNADALGDTLALGVRPVRAALPGARVPAYMRSEAEGIDVVPPVTRLDLPAVEAAAPDLILGSSEGQGRLYPGLSKIAPTVMSDGRGAAWELTVRLHGEALGRTNDAERLLIDWDRRVAALRKTLGDEAAETEVSVMLVTRGGILMAGGESFPGRVLSDVGLARPGSQDGVREFETVASDQIPALDADVILLAVGPGAESRFAELRENRLWNQLGAVRAGAVERVDAGTWWSGGGILAARAALEDLEHIL
jgi:ABC-type Fe3+-hydroxamate transport system substrate-binding protein